MPGERGQAVAVGGGEAAVATVDIGVEEAEPPAARAQRGNDAAALAARLDALGTVAQLRLAAATGLVQPGRDRRQQPLRTLAPRQQGGRDLRAGFRFEQQQHPPGTAQRGRLGDQVLADRGLSGRAG